MKTIKLINFSYMDDPYAQDLVNQATKGYNPTQETAYVTALKTKGGLLKSKYTGNNLLTPLPFTPETPGIKLKNANTISYNELLDLNMGVKNTLNVPKNSKLSRLHTHPTNVLGTDISTALKPPSSPDLINAGYVYSHPANKNLKANNNYIYTLENGKRVVYKYDVSDEDKQRYKDISLKTLTEPSLSNLPELYKTSNLNSKYTNMELKSGLLSHGQTLGKSLQTVWTDPGKTWNDYSKLQWENRGKNLFNEYQNNNIPVTREELR